MGSGISGTVGHEQTLPAIVFQSVAERAAAATGKSVTAALIRSARLRDLLASIAEWERASGPDRTYWRRDAQHRLAEWRTLYRQPERAAFQQAVARGRA